jgi:thioester reductase-like protein
LRQIFDSELFTTVFERDPQIKQIWPEKVKVVSGDLTAKGLGLTDYGREILNSHIDVVINCAASVNFDDPLQDALSINYFGVLKLLEIVKKSNKVLVFTHVSTAYVNTNRRSGLIEEKVYDLEGKQDPEDLVKEIMKLNPQQIQEQEKKIIGAWLNTYTFTKNLAEKVIKKKHGNLKTIIIRPSIVISSAAEPVVGWTETISAMGGVMFAVTLGLIQYLHSNNKMTVDIIPVD